MTTNQQQALDLAEAIIAEGVQLFSMTKAQWDLLLLASGASDHRTPPIALARRVMAQFYDRAGYFASALPTVDAPIGEVLPWFIG